MLGMLLSRKLVLMQPKPRIMNIKILMAALFAFSWMKIFPQDPYFTQFYSNPIYYNPALSGVGNGINVRSNYHDYWGANNSGTNTCDLTLDSYEPSLSGGLGLVFVTGTDAGGIIRSQQAGLAYSYNLVVKPRVMNIQMALQGGIIHRSINDKNLIFSDQIDAIYGNTGTTLMVTESFEDILNPDFSSGINMQLNLGKVKRGKPFCTINAGYAAHHINRASESFTGESFRTPMKHVAYSFAIINLEFSKNYNYELSPGFIFERQGGLNTLMFGSNLSFKPVYLGLWYRNKIFGENSLTSNTLALVAGFEYDFDKTFKIQAAYSYDINMARLYFLNSPVHEVSIRMNFKDLTIFRNSQHTNSRKVRENRACYNEF